MFKAAPRAGRTIVPGEAGDYGNQETVFSTIALYSIRP